LDKASTNKIVAIARSETQLQSLMEKYGEDRVGVVVGDVSDKKTSLEAVSLAVSKFGQINSIIANAGVLDNVNCLENIDLDGWRRDFDINLFAVVQLVQLSLPELRKTAGNVVAVSSGASTKGYDGWYAYGSTKAALNHFILSLAENEKEIHAISVAPGVVDTNMQADIRNTHSKGMTEAGAQRFIDLHSTRQLLSPDVPATVYVNLALKGWKKELNGSYLRYNDEVLAEYN